MNAAVSSRRLLNVALIAIVLVVGIVYILQARKHGSAAESETSSNHLTAAQVPPIHADKDPKAIALLPPGYPLATAGELTIATTPAALPLGDYAADDNSIIGVEPDIARLVADALGLRLNLVPVAWPDWPLGVTSGKYDAAISNITVTEERKKKFDFSSYRHDLLGIYTRTGGPIKAINGPADVAGLTVVVGPSTNQDQILRRWDAQNIAAGLKPVTYQYFDDDTIGRLAVVTGRADILFEPNAIAAYEARDGQIRRVGLFPGGWPNSADISVVTRKGSGLAAAITQALNTQIANGNYAKVLKRWNLSEEAVTQSQTNPPGLTDSAPASATTSQTK
jgi:polar amino acid transport system substrate-binding protein